MSLISIRTSFKLWLISTQTVQLCGDVVTVQCSTRHLLTSSMAHQICVLWPQFYWRFGLYLGLHYVYHLTDCNGHFLCKHESSVFCKYWKLLLTCRIFTIFSIFKRSGHPLSRRYSANFEFLLFVLRHGKGSLIFCKNSVTLADMTIIQYNLLNGHLCSNGGNNVTGW